MFSRDMLKVLLNAIQPNVTFLLLFAGSIFLSQKGSPSPMSLAGTNTQASAGDKIISGPSAPNVS